MRVSPGVMTFIIGLAVLAVAAVIYQQQLVASGAYGSRDGTVVAADVKYACPMRCAELDHPGECPVCGMEMTPIETAASAPAPGDAHLYTCPMHPQVVQDHEGTCPICGMELVPKSDDASAIDPATQELVTAVKLSPLQAVLSDVQPIHPELRQMTVEINAIGEVTIPEDQINSLVSWQAGRVDNLVLRSSGSYIAKGAHLLDIYSEELVQAQEEYILALDAVTKLGASEYASVSGSMQRLLEATQQKLVRLGLTESQLAGLVDGKPVSEHISIYASHGGTVMDKYVTEGMYIKEGDKLFSVADLSSVWVEVEVFERDMAALSVGDQVTLVCPIHPGMLFQGRVELIEPRLDIATRTHRARVVVNNPDSILLPGLILESRLNVDHGEMMVLPRNAVLHTGQGDLVYVLVGDNQWAPREVVIGHDFGDSLQILSGLAHSEAVAGTAVFLLDSEAQLKGVPRPLDSISKPQDPITSGGGGSHAGH